MKFAILGVLIVVALATVFGVQNSKLLFNPKAATNNTQEQVLLGPEQIVYSSPTSGLPDLPYFTYLRNNTPVGVFTSDDANFYISNPLSSPISVMTKIQGISKGIKPTDFDQGGIWLIGAYKDPSSNIIHGVYHAENYNNTQNAEDNTIYSIGYIRSLDGGVTWQKPNYPNNQIITGFSADGKVGGADAGSLIPVKEADGKWYFYLYYFEHTNIHETRGTALARAPISEAGNPTSWLKYRCSYKDVCGFKTPGLGGNFTKIPTLDGQSWVTYNDYLNKFLAVNAEPITNRNVVQFKTSTNGIDFTDFGAEQALGSPYPTNAKRAYVSQLSTEGIPGHTGQRFFLYYVTLTMNSSTGFPNPPRNLFKRKVTLYSGSVLTTTPTVSPNPTVTKVPTQTPTPVLSLIPTMSPISSMNTIKRAYNPTTKAHFYGISGNEESLLTAAGLIQEGNCCELNSTQVANSIPLYRVASDTDYFIEANLSQIQQAELQGFKGRTILGYCYPKTYAPIGTVPLYRFYSGADSDHFYTTSETERAKLLTSPGWVSEGLVCYVNK